MRERRGAWRAKRGVKHQLRLQTCDAVDFQPPAALEAFDEVLQIRLDLL